MPPKAHLPTPETLAGMEIVFNRVQPENAFPPIQVTVSGIRYESAAFPPGYTRSSDRSLLNRIPFTEQKFAFPLATDIASSLTHEEKLSSMLSAVLGIETVFRFSAP